VTLSCYALLLSCEVLAVTVILRCEVLAATVILRCEVLSVILSYCYAVRYWL